ncbi:MAG: hypothetical protein ACE5IQ_13705 [Candidatus Methylomirabilales bacterium]
MGARNWGRPMSTVMFLVVSGLLVGCSLPRPGFVGVPEQVDRSRDFALPLTRADRDDLLGFIIRGGRPPARSWSLEDEDPGRVREVREAYGALLDALARKAPGIEDLREGGALSTYFNDPDWILAVHDARVEDYDLDRRRARALLKGDFVFAFYLRRLEPVMVTNAQVPALGSLSEGTVWRLRGKEDAGGVYTGLVVFHKHFAIPLSAE